VLRYRIPTTRSFFQSRLLVSTGIRIFPFMQPVCSLPTAPHGLAGIFFTPSFFYHTRASKHHLIGPNCLDGLPGKDFVGFLAISA